MDVGQPLFYAIEEDWFNKLGEECIDKGGGCCIVEHGSEGKSGFGGLAKHDIVEVGFGVGEASAQVAGSRVILKDLVSDRDICFLGVGGAIEYSIAGFGDVYTTHRLTLRLSVHLTSDQ